MNGRNKFFTMSCSGDLSIKRTTPITEEFAVRLELKGPKMCVNHEALVNINIVQKSAF